LTNRKRCAMNMSMNILKKYLKQENIIPSLKGETREEIYAELLTLLAQRKEINDINFVLGLILKRDKLIDSYMGKGVVIVRLHFDVQKRISLVVGIKKEGIEEEVFDREKINIFIIIINPESGNEEYVNLVSSISILLNQGSIREDILEAKDNKAIAKILLE